MSPSHAGEHIILDVLSYALNGGLNIQSNAPNDVPEFFPDGPVIISDDHKFEFIAITKNARIQSTDKIVQVLAELEKHPWDIIPFSETRASSGTKVLDGGHVLYSTIDKNNVCAGVAILLHANM